MEIKNKYVIPIGINKDFGNSVFPEDKLFDAFNVNFVAQSDNNTYVITNEQGNYKVNLSSPILGNICGSVSGENAIIIFTTLNSIDRIYKLTKGENIFNFEVFLLFEGNLSFDTNYPIKAIFNYENNNIQKVYFTDGINSPKYINISNGVTITDPTKLDFVPEFNIDANINIVKNFSGGQFTAGTIQYAISYFYKYGAETNIFSISPIAYVSNIDKAGNPGETINCSFSLTIDNIDTRFDYIRIYTIERSSIDVEPICRKIDIKLSDSIIVESGINKIKFVDNGRIGTTFSAGELLYVGGESLLLGTIEARENVLFGGNITINRPSLKDVKTILGTNYINVNWKLGSSLILENANRDETIYGYKPVSLNEIQTSRRYFKNGEIYRIGFQAQYSTGRWSEVLYLGKDAICNLPIEMSSDSLQPLISFKPVIGDFTLSYAIVDKLKNLGYVAVRPVFVQPTINDRRVVAQGLLTNTITYGSEIVNVEAYSDYLLRTDVYWDGVTLEFPYTTAEERYQPTHFSSDHYRPIYNTSHLLYGKQPQLYATSDGDNAVAKTPYELYTMTYDYIYGSTVRLRELDIYAENLTTRYTVNEALHYKNISFNNTVDGAKNGFFVNQSIVDFWSPNIEFTTDVNNLIADNMYLKLVGIIPFTSNSISNEVIFSSSSDGIVFSSTNIKEESIKGFKDYSEESFDYTTSQGRTKAINTVAMSVNSTKSADIKDMKSIFLPTWCRKNILTRENDTDYKGTTSIVRKLTGRFHYSAFNRYFNNSYSFSLGINKPSYMSYDANSAMLNNISTSETSSSLVGNGMNKLFPNTKEVAKLTTIKYKTAPHWMFSLKSSSFNGATYRNVLPSLVQPTETIWYTTYQTLLNSSNNYIKQSIISNTTVDTSSPVFAGNNNPKAGETFCYLGEIIRDLGNSQYGGQIVTMFQPPSQEDGWFVYPEITEAVATPTALQNNLWIPCGDRVLLPGTPAEVNVVCSIGDTFLQRYDLVKTSPITETNSDGTISINSEDYQLNTTVVSFLVESNINLDGRYDKNRYNAFVHGFTSNNYNLINTVYSQYDNLFTYRGLDYEEFSIDNFKNSFTWSNIKINGEHVDSWLGFDLRNIYDCNGSLGKVTSFRQLGMYLLGFQETGIFNLLHNVRTGITPSDGVPIELSSASGVSGIRYITTTTGVQSDLVTAVSPKGLYFIDASNKYIGLYNTDGVVNLSEAKGLKSWTYNNITVNDVSTFFNSSGFAIYVDQIQGRVYFVNKNTCLIYSETFDVFLGFYSYNGLAGMFNIFGEVITLGSDGNPYIQYKGLYNHYFGTYANSYITYKFNPDPLIDKTFNWLDLGFDAFNIATETIRLTETGDLRNLETIGSSISNRRVTEELDPRLTEHEDYRIVEQDITEEADYRILEGSGDFHVPTRFFNTLTVSNEYQKNEVPLEVGLFTNAVKKFRRWKVTIPRDKYTINRFRNTWLNIKLTFVPEENKNIKFILYNTGIFYTIH